MRHMKTVLFLIALCVLPVIGMAAEGDMWIEPDGLRVQAGEEVRASVYVDSGSGKVAAYQLEINYDPTVLEALRDGVFAGSSGYVASVNINAAAGKIMVNGFDVYGVGPGSKLELVRLVFRARAAGAAVLNLKTELLADEKGRKYTIHVR